MQSIIRKDFFTEENIAHLSSQFNNAQPYKHLAIDNFLTPEFADKIYNHFPPLEVLNKH